MNNMFRALAGRDFRYFFIGQSLSLVGNWVQQVAMAWIVYRLTGSAFMLGLIAFCSQIPILVFSPLGGLAADRCDKRRVLLAIQAVQMAIAAALALLAWRHGLAVWHLIAASLALGLTGAFEMPARLALVPAIVQERADLPNAIALNSIALNIARLVGPGLAGFALAAVGDAACFAINAASFAASIWGLLVIHPLRGEPRSGGTLREAAVYLRTFAPARWMLITVVVASFCLAPYLTFMPVYAKDIMGGGPDTLGVLMSAYGFGALIAGVYLANRRTIIGLGPRIVGACFVAGLLAVAFAYNQRVSIALPLLVLAGCAQIIVVTSCNILLQSLVTDAMRGRVMAFYSMCFLCMLPLSGLVAGAIAHAAGVQPVFVLSAAAFIALGLVLRPRISALREEALRELRERGEWHLPHA